MTFIRLSSLGLLFLLSSCGDQAKVDTALTSPGGQLFCAFETNGHAQIIGTLIAAGVSAASGPAGPAAGQGIIMATNTTAQAAQAACAQAAANIGARAGVPVSPPPADVVVPAVAVDVSKLPVAPAVAR